MPDCEAPVRGVSVPSSPTSKYAALVEACRAHLFVAERIPADETAVPAVTNVLDDRPFAGPVARAAAFSIRAIVTARAG